MLKIGKILVPTDFSDPSKKALQYAVELATLHQSEIVLVHVAPVLIYEYPPNWGTGVALDATYDKALRDRLRKELADLRIKNVPDKIASRAVLRDGTPFHEILRQAADDKADLIVIATHGRTGIKHMFLGSTAERVVREARCPVLVVRDKERELIR